MWRRWFNRSKWFPNSNEWCRISYLTKVLKVGVFKQMTLGSIATTSSPEAYQVNYVLNANTGWATYNVKGNIKIDDSNGDIFIYS